MIINGERYLINEDSKASDKFCEQLINSYPSDALVEFDEVKKSDVI